MNDQVFECNAVISSTSLQIERGSFLSAWLQLDFGGSGQGFGGFVLYGDTDPCGRLHSLNYAGHFIYRCLQIAGVEKWSELVGKTIRVRKVKDSWGDIISVGHIVKDDWFDFKREQSK